MQYTEHLKISNKWRCIKRKIINFSGSTPVRRLSTVNPHEKSYKPHMFRNCSSLATFLSLIVKAYIHSVTHGWLRNTTYVRQACCLEIAL